MDKTFYKIIALVAVVFFIASCVQFKTATLYDGVEPLPVKKKPEDIKLLVEPTIFYDDDSDVWGLENEICKEASLSTTVAYSGTQSIKVSWNRGEKGCKWAGIGIGWDGYAGKDLSGIMDFAAIQMYVRSQEGRTFGLPIVLTLEDYSGGMGFAYTSNKYFERTAIDENWQRVVVPLNEFDLDTENLDPTNIKQLQLEFQQSGSFYLDDIKLVFYEPEPQEPWMEEEVLPDPVAMPITLMDDAFINNNGWGLVSNPCQQTNLTSDDKSEGSKSLYARWDANGEDCGLTAFGISWNKWHPTDVSSVRSSAAIEFDIRLAEGTSDKVNMHVGFEDYDRVRNLATLSSDLVEGNQYTTSWSKVTIPFTAMNSANLDWTRVKHVHFKLDGTGEVYIDNIRLINQLQ
jgi:hypothetical protein